MQHEESSTLDRLKQADSIGLNVCFVPEADVAHVTVNLWYWSLLLYCNE